MAGSDASKLEKEMMLNKFVILKDESSPLQEKEPSTMLGDLRGTYLADMSVLKQKLRKSEEQ